MKGHTYVSKEPDANGLFPYTDEENKIWAELMARQANILPGRACPEYLQALDVINFPKDRVPQLKEVTTTLMRETGWSVEPVPALISFKKFFTLLAERKFPAATFIRLREEMDYLQEPDIFHEVFGHCPLLVNPVYANFMQKYGEMGLQVAKEDRAMLARLYWFTVEFGLMKRNGTLGIYGAGIVSSKGESVYALESRVPERKPLDLVTCFRTPYRYDIFQHTYFVIESFEELFDLVNRDLLGAVAEAKRLGMLPPNYDVDGDADAINARLMAAS